MPLISAPACGHRRRGRPGIVRLSFVRCGRGDGCSRAGSDRGGGASRCSGPAESARTPAASRPISSTPTPSRRRTRACRSSLSSVRRATATSGITSIYLQGIDNAEIIEAVHARRAPMMPVGTTLRLWARGESLVARSDSAAARTGRSRRAIAEERDQVRSLQCATCLALASAPAGPRSSRAPAKDPAVRACRQAVRDAEETMIATSSVCVVHSAVRT
jgi:hypothetical protein